MQHHSNPIPHQPKRDNMKHKKRTSAREVRTYTSALPLTVRTMADGRQQVSGYAIVFNSPSVDQGGFTEIVAPSALDRTLRENSDISSIGTSAHPADRHSNCWNTSSPVQGRVDMSNSSTGAARSITASET